MNVLMIGAGDIAKSHGRAVVKLGGKVFAAYDVNEAGLKRYAEEFGCEMLTYEQIEENVPRADYNKLFPSSSFIVQYMLMSIPSCDNRVGLFVGIDVAWAGRTVLVLRPE